jgi:hypothetical protein
VAPCSHAAAKYAVMNWHYSKSMPAGKLVRYGVWEADKFIGCVLYARGASPFLGTAYGLKQTEVCELVRVALTTHSTPVSQLISLTLSKLKQSSQGLRLVVSFADPYEGHHGGIYQAGNWTYAGKSADKHDYIDGNGRRWKDRQVTATGWVTEFGKRKPTPKRGDCTPLKVPGKHRYLMPLDKAMRRQIQKLAQPYPCGQSVVSDTSSFQEGEASATLADRSTTPRQGSAK